ncbi:MAG: formylglycine-generating enzyme family protein [Chitinivibrionales bacterium]|nr:formylglycine-generating enzyme family protein [Chitinivibrionales bacterium]
MKKQSIGRKNAKQVKHPFIIVGLILVVALGVCRGQDSISTQKLRTISVNGSVEIWSKLSNSWITLKPNSPLCTSCAVRTLDKSSVQISFEPAITATVEQKSVLSLDNLLIHKTKKTIRMLMHLQVGIMHLEIPDYIGFQVLCTIETPTATVFINKGSINLTITNDITTADVIAGSIKIKHRTYASQAVVYDKCRAMLFPTKEGIQISALSEAYENQTKIRQSSPQQQQLQLKPQQSQSIAILSIQSQSIAKDNLETISDYVAEEIERQSTISVLFLNDVRAMLKSEGMEKILDCYTDSCISLIGTRIGVDKVVLGNVSKLGSKFLFNLKMVDVLRDKVESRVSVSVDEDAGLILDKISPMITTIVKDNSEKTSRFDRAGSPPPPIQNLRLLADSSSKKVPEANAHRNMVLIRGGKFLMGSSRGEGTTDEWPQHQVSISAFYMDQYEVTKADFERLMAFNPSGYKGCQQCPVDNLTFFEAQQYCEKAGKRLPTEAEWEYACRSGTTQIFGTGNTLSSSQANFDGSKPYGGVSFDVNRSKPMPVGSYSPNQWGLFDMHGNVWEWCADWYGQNYYDQSPAADPTGPQNGVYKILRGGSWENDGSSLRCANRIGYNPYVRLKTIGLRCVISAKSE